MSNEKDYTSVDLAVHINSHWEVTTLYSEITKHGLAYTQDRGGPLLTIGKIDNRPIVIAPLIIKIGTINILYVEATSVLVDWDMINNWIIEKIGKDKKIVTDPINLLSNIRSSIRQKEQQNTKEEV